MKTNRLKYLFPLALLAASSVLPMVASARQFEPIRTERNDVKPIIRETDIEIKATRGVIQITLSRPMNVKIFSILGRQVCNETAPAGTSQMIVRAHGVYIVKIGDVTAKVAA